MSKVTTRSKTNNSSKLLDKLKHSPEKIETKTKKIIEICQADKKGGIPCHNPAKKELGDKKFCGTHYNQMVRMKVKQTDSGHLKLPKQCEWIFESGSRAQSQCTNITSDSSKHPILCKSHEKFRKERDLNRVCEHTIQKTNERCIRPPLKGEKYCTRCKRFAENTEDIPRCKHILKNGIRENEMCNKKCEAGSAYCKSHKNSIPHREQCKATLKDGINRCSKEAMTKEEVLGYVGGLNIKINRNQHPHLLHLCKLHLKSNLGINSNKKSNKKIPDKPDCLFCTQNNIKNNQGLFNKIYGTFNKKTNRFNTKFCKLHRPICQALTKNNTPCTKFTSNDDSKYCTIHQKLFNNSDEEPQKVDNINQPNANKANQPNAKAKIKDKPSNDNKPSKDKHEETDNNELIDLLEEEAEGDESEEEFEGYESDNEGEGSENYQSD